MSEPKREVEDTIVEQSDEYSIINNPNYPKFKRMALVRSKTDLLQLTLKDIKDAVELERSKKLSFIPADLLPLEINLADGEKVTILESNPVMTLYDGELKNPKGDVLHIYEEKPENLKPPYKMFTCTPDTFESVLSLVFEELAIPRTTESKSSSIPGTSKTLDTPDPKNEELACNKKNESTSTKQIMKDSYLSTSDNTSPSVVGSNAEVEMFTQEKNFDQSEHIKPRLVNPEKKCLKQNYSFKENYTSPLFSRVQVLGAITVDSIQTSDTATIMDEDLGKNFLTPIFLKIPSANPIKKSVEVRKSARTPKPKIRSPFKSWDELKMRLPRHAKKAKPSKGTQVKNQVLDAITVDSIQTVMDKDLGKSFLTPISLKVPSANPMKKSAEVRKSARTPKPKIRSPFKSWDELKMRLPRHAKKTRPSKGTQVKNSKTTAK